MLDTGNILPLPCPERYFLIVRMFCIKISKQIVLTGASLVNHPVLFLRSITPSIKVYEQLHLILILLFQWLYLIHIFNIQANVRLIRVVFYSVFNFIIFLAVLLNVHLTNGRNNLGKIYNCLKYYANSHDIRHYCFTRQSSLKNFMNYNYRPATKKKIFFAACKLFSQTCYADVGIREIARESGIKVATVYNYYPSKEAILDDLMQFYMERLTQFHSRTNDIDYNQNPIDCFRKMVFVYKEDEIDLMRQLMRIVLCEQYRSPQAAKSIFDISFRSAKKSYYDFLLHLKNKGVIQCNGIDSFAEFFSRIGTTFAMQYVRDDEIDRRPDYEKVMMDLFELILKSKEP